MVKCAFTVWQDFWEKCFYTLVFEWIFFISMLAENLTLCKAYGEYNVQYYGQTVENYPNEDEH